MLSVSLRLGRMGCDWLSLPLSLQQRLHSSFPGVLKNLNNPFFFTCFFHGLIGMHYPWPTAESSPWTFPQEEATAAMLRVHDGDSDERLLEVILGLFINQNVPWKDVPPSVQETCYQILHHLSSLAGQSRVTLSVLSNLVYLLGKTQASYSALPDDTRAFFDRQLVRCHTILTESRDSSLPSPVSEPLQPWHVVKLLNGFATMGRSWKDFDSSMVTAVTSMIEETSLRFNSKVLNPLVSPDTPLPSHL